MKLFKTCIQHNKSVEWIYAVADNGHDAIKKIIENKFKGITGLPDLEKQKNDIRKHMKEVTGGVDWYWSDLS
jgi:hypothetical protein